MPKRMWPYTGRYKKYLAISCFCVVAETVFELIISIIMADITDIGVVSAGKDHILIKGAQMIAYALVALVSGILYARYAVAVGQGFGAELRKDEFVKVQSFPFVNTDHFSTSPLITRPTGDMTVSQTAISNEVRPIARSPVMLLTVLVLTFTIGAQLAAVFLTMISVLGIALFIIAQRVGPLHRLIQASIDKANTIIQENLSAIRIMKSYVRGIYEEEKFEEVNGSLCLASGRVFRIPVWNSPLFQLVMCIIVVCIIWFGGNMILAGAMKVGELTGFPNYVLQILNSLVTISGVFSILTRPIASGECIFEVLGKEVDIRDLPQAIASVQHEDTAFGYVHFKYREEIEEFALSDITLYIEKDNTAGILGDAGSAKTMFAQPTPRLYNVNGNEIRIDGKDAWKYSVEHLCSAVGMALQESTLSSGTIRENLSWDDTQASGVDIAWACRIVYVGEFINSFPKGYDTDPGQGDVNVSGEQKQRLCIVRALLECPRALTFGDFTNAIDTVTKAGIREGLASLKDITKVIIVQRVTSIQYADQIVILDDGKIHAIGTHDTLLVSDPIYQDIYYSQQEGTDL